MDVIVLYFENRQSKGFYGIWSDHRSGHDVPIWNLVSRDKKMQSAKSFPDAEPNYEDHPVNPWLTWNPENDYYRDYNVRKQNDRSAFSGCCGVTYGHHSIRQFWSPQEYKFKHAGRYLMVYIPVGKPFSVRTSDIRSRKVKAWWVDPRTAAVISAVHFRNKARGTRLQSQVCRVFPLLSFSFYLLSYSPCALSSALQHNGSISNY